MKGKGDLLFLVFVPTAVIIVLVMASIPITSTIVAKDKIFVNGSTEYTFGMENGQTVIVKLSTYNSYNIGDEYHYCGWNLR